MWESYFSFFPLNRLFADVWTVHSGKGDEEEDTYPIAQKQKSVDKEFRKRKKNSNICLPSSVQHKRLQRLALYINDGGNWHKIKHPLVSELQ